MENSFLRSKDFWDNLEIVSSYGIMIAFFFMILSNNEFVWTISLISIALYGAFLFGMESKMENLTLKMYAGNFMVKGVVDEEEGEREEFRWMIERFDHFTDLSEEVRGAVDKFFEEEKNNLEVLEVEEELEKSLYADLKDMMDELGETEISKEERKVIESEMDLLKKKWNIPGNTEEEVE